MKRLSKFALAASLAGAAVFMAVPRMQAAEPQKNADAATRTVTGRVVDKNEATLGGAVVYLKNTKTLAVKSFIAGDDGAFRFHALSKNVDYEVYAEYNGTRSNTKTVSSFDSRAAVNFDLKVDIKK
jgi:hypothetical protein